MGEGPRLNVAFFGSGGFGLPTLAWLAANHNLLTVVTQPDRPAGRKRVLTPTPIGAYAAERLPGVPLLKPEDVNSAEHLSFLRSLPLGKAVVDHRAHMPRVEAGSGMAPGAAIVIAFGQKLGTELLADRFFINLHASLLPRWRGAAPINRALEAGDSETGNSVITLADRMDAGLVLAKTTRAIESGVTAGELHDLLAADGPAAIEGVLGKYAGGTIRPAAQDESLVTTARKLSKREGDADFGLPAAAFARRVCAFNPWPCVTASFRGEPVKLLRAVANSEEAVAAGVEAGMIVDPSAGLIACGETDGIGTVRLLEVQPAGKKPMDWSAFANGAQPETGETFTSPAATQQAE